MTQSINEATMVPKTSEAAKAANAPKAPARRPDSSTAAMIEVYADAMKDNRMTQSAGISQFAAQEKLVDNLSAELSNVGSAISSSNLNEAQYLALEDKSTILSNQSMIASNNLNETAMLAEKTPAQMNNVLAHDGTRLDKSFQKWGNTKNY